MARTMPRAWLGHHKSFLRLGFVEQVNLLQELVFKLPVVQPQAIYEPFWTLSLPKACPRWVLAYKPNEKGLP
jgi:hypothetical protein